MSLGLRICRGCFKCNSATPDTSGWNTSSVTDMSHMFSLTDSANPDVSGWDVSNVTDMEGMFSDATSAEPDVSQWDFSSVTNMTSIFGGISLPTENYSAMLNRIVATSSKSNVALSVGDSVYYNGRAILARKTLVGRGWTISDQGFDPDARFVSTWTTTSASESITLPLPEGPSGSEHNYDFTVDWGMAPQRVPSQPIMILTEPIPTPIQGLIQSRSQGWWRLGVLTMVEINSK